MIQEWTLLTIGNLSRNRFWGESDDKAYRPALCTSTLIQGDNFNLLVDPSVADAEEMAATLDRRTGKRPEDVEAVFITHAHGDHFCGLHAFPKATWLAVSSVADKLNDENLPKRVIAVDESPAPGIQMLSTPGHTPDHTSLLFEWKDRIVLVAADAAMTRDFWEAGVGYFNSLDPEQAAKTIESLRHTPDIVIPGHGNYFLNDMKD